MKRSSKKMLSDLVFNEGYVVSHLNDATWNYRIRRAKGFKDPPRSDMILCPFDLHTWEEIEEIITLIRSRQDNSGSDNDFFKFYLLKK
jgi:hypothetical protein